MTKYDLFRRRIAPIAFALALGFIAYDTCNKQQRTSATIVIDYGAAERDVHAIEADVWMNNEQVSQFHREAQGDALIGKTQFKASLPDTDGELRIDVELANGEHRKTSRAIHVAEGASVTIQLERDLR